MQGVVAGLILFAVGVSYWTMPREEEFPGGPDEIYYVKYARAVSEGGLTQIPSLFLSYMNDAQAQRFPHPGRVGHTLINALWCKVFGPTYRSLAHLSFLCFVVFLFVSYYFAKKYCGIDAALVYALFLSSSPLIMASARRVLQDSMLNLFWALSFWFFLDYLMTRRRKMFVWFCVAFTVALTVKEATAPVWLFFAAAWLVFKFCYQRDLPWKDLGLLFIPFGAALVLYIVLLGGLNNFVTLVDFVSGLAVMPTSDFPDTYPLFAMGPWYKYVVDFLLLTPAETLLFIGYFFYLLMVRKIDQVRAYALMFFGILFVFFSNLQHTKIVRFVMSLEIVVCLFAVFAIYQLFQFKNKHLTSSLVIILAFVIFLANILNYASLYCEMRIYDPTSVWLLMGKKIIPHVRF